MTTLPPVPKHKSASEIASTIVLWLILAVMGWVGISINQLRDASNAQNIAQAQMQTKFDDMQQSLKPLSDALPAVSREVDKHDVQLADHERRIAALEQVKGLRQ
ncbi:hypothetical protein [Dyella mobilis]|uniref:Uncharacterized protein n=1 Tax=Dyella mobilis TaxID=1849582 RepID=A0ABS2KK80_9GAMM|nr:hypothetical protein [Dyella mobilis]MBM7131572.1 hypothetical protein [Dyella mobilis]GLQ96456.1 hypothetical protein GCM10007863_08740 [Dyella mobilis]